MKSGTELVYAIIKIINDYKIWDTTLTILKLCYILELDSNVRLILFFCVYFYNNFFRFSSDISLLGIRLKRCVRLLNFVLVYCNQSSFLFLLCPAQATHVRRDEIVLVIVTLSFRMYFYSIQFGLQLDEHSIFIGRLHSIVLFFYVLCSSLQDRKQPCLVKSMERDVRAVKYTETHFADEISWWMTWNFHERPFFVNVGFANVYSGALTQWR